MALLGVIVVALSLALALRNIAVRQLVAGALLGLMLGALLVLLAGFVPKGPYILYFGVFAALLLCLHWPRAGTQGSRRIYCTAGFFGLMVTAANVADHWGGSEALWGMIGALTVVLVAVLVGIFSARPAWPGGLRWQGTFMSAAVAVSAVIAVFIGGGYMGDRFTTSSKDMEGRLDHWRVSTSMLQTPLDVAFGKGLGRYPANYFFAIPDSKFPGTYQIVKEGEGAWLSLVGARHPMSFGDIFRVSQRLDFGSAGPFEVTLKVKARTDVVIHSEVCEKQLLYPGGCAVGSVSIKASDGLWEAAQIRMVGPSSDRWPVVCTENQDVFAGDIQSEWFGRN